MSAMVVCSAIYSHYLLFVFEQCPLVEDPISERVLCYFTGRSWLVINDSFIE